MIFVASNLSSKSIDAQFAATTPFPTVSIASSQNLTVHPVTPAASRNIELLAPYTGDEVKSGFVVKGNARTFENTVNIRLSDSSGNVLVETFTTANAPDVGQFGPFEKEIDFDSVDSEGLLEVFQYSAKDGSEIDKVKLPLIFSQ